MPHPVDVHVGKRMRRRREMRGMPQKELAAKLGISFQQVQKYESGANRISASKMWELCGQQVLDVDPDFFFEGLVKSNGAGKRGKRVEPTLTEKDHANARQVLDLNQSFQKIPDIRVRRQLVQLLKALTGDREQ